MKKLVGLILTVCFVFLATNTIWPASAPLEGTVGSILNLYSTSEFSSRLESENVDVTNASAYEISVLIELDDIAMLPSGIVVLADEDIQVYLDGTLVFYHPDNIPTMQ